ncbi:MAG: DUF3291 domain-containing protein [Chloroflexota bacterium]
MPKHVYHIAEINIGRILEPLDSPMMAEFTNNLDQINALADGSPGFVWRLVGEGNDASSLRPFDDDMIIVNMSVWESVEALHTYVYKSHHTDFLRWRKEWFSKMTESHFCMWWVRAGHEPTVREAKEHLEHLRVHGETATAFTFKTLFPAPGEDK